MKRTALFMFGVMLAACSGPAHNNNPVTGVEADGTPKWVHRGSGAFEEKGAQAFFGVGIADGIHNEALSRQTADNRARGQVAKMFDTYVAAMMKDYMRSTTAGDMSASSEEQDVVSAQKTITEVTLRGVEIRDHWMNPASGALYALAVLDIQNFMKSLNKANQLSARVRDYVRANARRAFTDLDVELNKRSDRNK